mgnify:CR=1 FL=1
MYESISQNLYEYAQQISILREKPDFVIAPAKILTEKLTGPIALAFGFNDPVSPAKNVVKFIKEANKGVILGAALDGKLLSEAETQEINFAQLLQIRMLSNLFMQMLLLVIM